MGAPELEKDGEDRGMGSEPHFPSIPSQIATHLKL